MWEKRLPEPLEENIDIESLSADRQKLFKVQIFRKLRLASKIFENGNNFWLFRCLYLTYALSRAVTFFVHVLRAAWRTDHISLGGDKLGIVFDLTRQHLPPAISQENLNSFFFDQSRFILSKDINRLVILTDLPNLEVDKEKGLRILFLNSLISLAFSSVQSRKQRFFIIFRALSHSISTLVESKKVSLDILSDILEICIFKKTNLRFHLLTAIVTNSSFNNYPPLFYISASSREFRRYMIHYSENDWPLTELELSDNNLEWVRESRVDKHLVWTEEFANYIKSKNPVLKVEVKGSLIFQPLPRKDFLPYLEKSISVFDIVPSIEENPLGPYNERSCISFLSGINQVRQLFLNNGGVPPLFILKSKRRIINSHSRVYLRYRTELESLGVIKVVPWYFNLYDLILSSKFVVCAIGSSPALIAREYKIPVAFHYQGQHKLADPIVDYGIPRTSHPQELYDLIQRALINQGDGGN